MYGDPIDAESAWLMYLDAGLLVLAIEEAEMVEVIVEKPHDPNPKRACFQPILHTYDVVGSVDWSRVTDASYRLHYPFKIEGRLYAGNASLYVLCLVDQQGNKGLMWPLAHGKSTNTLP